MGLGTLLFGVTAAISSWVNVNSFYYLAGQTIAAWPFSLLIVLLRWRYNDRSESLPQLLLGSDNHTRIIAFGRAACLYTFQVMWLFSLLMMPQGDATVIIFSIAPMLTAVCARLFLGEPIRKTIVAVFLVNISGTTLVTRPTFIFGGATRPAYWTGAAVGGASTIFAAASTIFTRKLPKDCHWTTIVHWEYAAALFVFSPLALALFFFSDASGFASSSADVGCILASRTECHAAPDFHVRSFALSLWLISCIVQYAGKTAQTRGYQVAEHTQRANLASYIEIPFAFLLQVAMYGKAVDTLSLIGISIVVVASAVGFVFGGEKPMCSFSFGGQAVDEEEGEQEKLL